MVSFLLVVAIVEAGVISESPSNNIKDVKYIVGDVKTNECPDGTDFILDMEECKNVDCATVETSVGSGEHVPCPLGEFHQVTKRDGDQIPKGCVYAPLHVPGGQFNSYGFNSDATGGPSTGLAPLCRVVQDVTSTAQPLTTNSTTHHVTNPVKLSHSGPGAQYLVHDNTNVELDSAGKNLADLVGCQASPGKDVRHNPTEMQKCLDECTQNSKCVGVTFHSLGSMLKQAVNENKIEDMMVPRDGFETYVKPSVSRCYKPSKPSDDGWCQQTCGYALQHGFLAGNGDSTAHGSCCWHDCEHQTYQDLPYYCFCDESKDGTQVIV